MMMPMRDATDELAENHPNEVSDQGDDAKDDEIFDHGGHESHTGPHLAVSPVDGRRAEWQNTRVTIHSLMNQNTVTRRGFLVAILAMFGVKVEPRNKPESPSMGRSLRQGVMDVKRAAKNLCARLESELDALNIHVCIRYTPEGLIVEGATEADTLVAKSELRKKGITLAP